MTLGGEGGSGEKQPELRPLHGGRHRLPAEVVAFNQRERLLAAVAEVACERGYTKMTVAQITGSAAVSRRTFYEHFADKEDVFLAAYDAVEAHLMSLLDAAAEEVDEWPAKVAAVLAELTRFLAAHPQLARLYLVEAQAVGEAMVERRERSAERLMVLLEGGRGQAAAAGLEPAAGLEEALVGGVMTLLSRRVGGGEAERLERFAPPLVELVLSPYLGAAEARTIASGV